MNTIDWAKKRISLLAGRNIILKVNKGRNKFITFNGVIDNVYPSIFTVTTADAETNTTLSYSYNDVLTKTVRFYPLTDHKEIKETPPEQHTL